MKTYYAGSERILKLADELQGKFHTFQDLHFWHRWLWTDTFIKAHDEMVRAQVNLRAAMAMYGLDPSALVLAEAYLKEVAKYRIARNL